MLARRVYDVVVEGKLLLVWDSPPSPPAPVESKGEQDFMLVGELKRGGGHGLQYGGRREIYYMMVVGGAAKKENVHEGFCSCRHYVLIHETTTIFFRGRGLKEKIAGSINQSIKYSTTPRQATALRATKHHATPHHTTPHHTTPHHTTPHHTTPHHTAPHHTTPHHTT